MMQEQSIPTESVSSLITDNPLCYGGTPTTAQPNVNFNAISMADATNPAFEVCLREKFLISLMNQVIRPHLW